MINPEHCNHDNVESWDDCFNCGEALEGFCLECHNDVFRDPNGEWML